MRSRNCGRDPQAENNAMSDGNEAIHGQPSYQTCPHCGLTTWQGYGGTPQCQQQYYGGQRPTFPGCLIAKQQLAWAQQTLGPGGWGG